MSDLSKTLLESLNQGRGMREDSEPTEDGFSPDMEEIKAKCKLDIVDNTTSVEDTPQSDATNDYKKVRNITYACSELLTNILPDVACSAVVSENPRAYSAVVEVVTSIRGLNKDLMDINKAMFDIRMAAKETDNPRSEDEEGSSGLSTSDLLKLLKE